MSNQRRRHVTFVAKSRRRPDRIRYGTDNPGGVLTFTVEFPHAHLKAVRSTLRAFGLTRVTFERAGDGWLHASFD